ncbi:putative double-stranded DNA-binding domain [Cryptosporidium bovis]|uniref:putative double-stranded DNA-binding domain n=1 Tax=Cryptosporidium bovis TaxID=310047 RepID=UPI003519EFE6|nr:putative double-stranded DNA-binding domain [Cryptosporidium bovis]
MANFNNSNGGTANFPVGDGLEGVNSREGKQPSNISTEEQKVIEQRRAVLRTILEPSAIERLNRIALVKPDRAIQVEDYILRTARSSGFSQQRKLQESELVNILSMINESSEQKSKITIYRRELFDEDDGIDF